MRKYEKRMEEERKKTGYRRKATESKKKTKKKGWEKCVVRQKRGR